MGEIAPASTAFAFSKAGWINMSTVTGTVSMVSTVSTVSALSSILVMTIICRSKDTRSSAYHCILFFMSFGDVIASIALTDINDVYVSDEKSYGNETTCEAHQSFAVLLGVMISVSSNVILNLFYVCTIKYGMGEVTFKKKILLPIALLLSLAITIGLTTLVLCSSSYFNPRPFDSNCHVGTYPMDTYKRDDGASEIYTCCERDVKEAYPAAITTLSALTTVGLIIVICSMCLVVSTVFRREMAIKEESKSQCVTVDRDRHQDCSNEETNENHSHTTRLTNESEGFKQTKIIACQAFMYIGAFIVTWLWLLMLVFIGGEGSETYYSIVHRLKVFFQPLQGFINASIFLWHKAYTLCRSDSNLTFLEALRKAILLPYEVPEILIEGIDILDREENEEDVESGDPTLSFELQSKQTPSFNLSKALSESSRISSTGNIMTTSTHRKDNRNTKETKKSPYRFYRYPISIISKSNASSLP